LLTPEDLKQIDRTGRRILERIGIKILDGDLLRRLKDEGAQVDHDNQRVRFEGDWLDQIINRAPSSFVLYSRDGKNDLHLGEGNVYFGNGGRVFRVLDMATGGYRLTKLMDVGNTASLVHNLDNLRFYIIACQAHDIKPVNNRGIPVTCAPAPIAGATSPATLAGTLSQLHAEALAGIALVQVLAPGAKVLYGAVPTIMDLRKMDFTSQV